MKLFAKLLFLLIATVTITAAGEKTNPLPLRTPPPEYPNELRSERVEGIVVIKLTIDEHGKVANAEVSKSSDGRLSPLALKAVLRWRFKPATEDGTPISTQATIPIQFRLDA